MALDGKLKNTLETDGQVGFINGRANRKSKQLILVDKTVDVETDEVILVDTSLGDVLLDWPLSTTITDDGKIRAITIKKVSSDTNVVNITLSGSDTFIKGNSSVELHCLGQMVIVGAMYGQYALQSQVDIETLAHKDTSWASTNFSSATPITFDHVDIQDDTNIIEWDGATKITCKIATRIFVDYKVLLDSTGGATWNAFTNIKLNRTTIVDYMEGRGGNYGNEDDSINVGEFPIDMGAGDYLELYIEQSNLTGNLLDAVINVSTVL